MGEATSSTSAAATTADASRENRKDTVPCTRKVQSILLSPRPTAQAVLAAQKETPGCNPKQLTTPTPAQGSMDELSKPSGFQTHLGSCTASEPASLQLKSSQAVGSASSNSGQRSTASAKPYDRVASRSSSHSGSILTTLERSRKLLERRSAGAMALVSSCMPKAPQIQQVQQCQGTGSAAIPACTASSGR